VSGRWARGILLCMTLGGIGVIAYVQLVPARSDAGQSEPDLSANAWPGNDRNVVFSAPGVTEPASRALQIFSELPGIIRQVYVKSGDRVSKGQLLFELTNDTQSAAVRHREALVRMAKANLAKLKSWEREEDRRIAKAQWEEAEAMADLARSEQDRVALLVPQGAAPPQEISFVRETYAAAEARAGAAKARYDLAIAGPSTEDLEVAQAAVAEAQSQLEIAKTQLDKTQVRSPIDGIVIYRFREPGEAVLPDIPKPVLSLGNRDTLHLRADVDETDIARVRPGQRIFATVLAFGSKRFAGEVVHVEQTLGRKNFRTYRPTEKADTKILEVVIALEDGRDLPLDLQMTVWFLNDSN